MPVNALKRPFRRGGNSVVKPLANFATGLVERDKLYMLLPWVIAFFTFTSFKFKFFYLKLRPF